MYGIFTYIWVMFWGRCRQIFQHDELHLGIMNQYDSYDRMVDMVVESFNNIPIVGTDPSGLWHGTLLMQLLFLANEKLQEDQRHQWLSCVLWDVA